MNDLASIQAELSAALRDPLPLVGRPTEEVVAARIARGNERLAPAEQVDIYREQFFLRHLDVLLDDFMSIAHLLGDDAFDALGRAYLEAHPPSSFTLRDLGHAMTDFIARTAPWSADPLLADLSRVEWAFVEAFDAADAPPLDPSTMASAREDAWSGARIILHPAVQRIALGHPAHHYRQLVREGAPASRPQAMPAFVVIHRPADVLHCVDVEADAFAMLDELAHGATLADACESAARAAHVDVDAFHAKLAGWFQQWTRAGWLSEVRF